jgi:preprotein translocase subunit SecA
MLKLSDEELRGKTEEFRKRLQDGETLDKLLVEAFAAVREAARRTIGLEPYPVQLIGGVILHQGRVAEMQTGEGKTLVAVLPAYLNALEGKGVCVVTVNDYLAARDADLMRPVYEFMGMTVGHVGQDMATDARKKAYNCDITYVTNNELGFDYLRDHIASDLSQQVLRGLHYAIIDECDSVLIDEARTPLIISGQGDNDPALLQRTDAFVRTLTRGEDIRREHTKFDYMVEDIEEETGDYMVNEKDKYVTLTAAGIEKAEQYFAIHNLADPEHMELNHCITLSLRAHCLMQRDHDYIVRDGEVLIVDDFTGRILPGRRYSDGLHQAIEAKEHVEIRQENVTLATITFQNFFNKFDKKCGMTGTAITEEQEFRDIYSMDVVAIPTNRPVIRKDDQDIVYRTKKDKFEAVVDAIEEAHSHGQPVLVGTVDIETNEMLSAMLDARGLKHRVLNAKYDAYEAEIIAQAGQHGAITIATNMAGRGTDIKLDPPARDAGGLLVIGTQRHDSRRIDNQLRGRSGRQGDPGRSVFYLSLEDELIRIFGGDKLSVIYDAGNIHGGIAIDHPLLTKAIESAQKNIESTHCQARKNVLEYDEVLNTQREWIYGERQKILEKKDLREDVLFMIRALVTDELKKCLNEDGEYDLARINECISSYIPGFCLKEIGDDPAEESRELAVSLYQAKEQEIDNPPFLRNMERYVILRIVDRSWTQQMEAMDVLKEQIQNEIYANRDPKVAYRIGGYDLYQEMVHTIQAEVVKTLFGMKVEYEDIKEDTTICLDASQKPVTLAKTFTIAQRPKAVFTEDPA